jgi:hypothetical protein
MGLLSHVRTTSSVRLAKAAPAVSIKTSPAMVRMAVTLPQK